MKSSHLGPIRRIRPIRTIAALLLIAFPLQAKTLNIVLLANASTQGTIQQLIHEYERQNSGTIFNISIVQLNSLTAKLNTLVTGGQPPDIAEITTSLLQNYAGQAVDLGKYTEGPQLAQRYLPSLRPFLTSGSKIIGMPPSRVWSGPIDPAFAADSVRCLAADASF